MLIGVALHVNLSDHVKTRITSYDTWTCLNRAPVVAKCDRSRVLTSWAPYCGNIAPSEFHIEFSSVRHLSPQQFVEKLSKELRVCGVVAGMFSLPIKFTLFLM